MVRIQCHVSQLAIQELLLVSGCWLLAGIPHKHLGVSVAQCEDDFLAHSAHFCSHKMVVGLSSRFAVLLKLIPGFLGMTGSIRGLVRIA